jgi:aspartate beta-hydroxylase
MRNPSRQEISGWASRGQQALAQGQGRLAAELFGRAAAAMPAHADLWLGQAMALGLLGDTAAQIASLDRALAADPRHLVALLLKGDAQARSGASRPAAQTFSAALAVAPPFNQVPPDLQPLVRQAAEAVKRFRVDYEESLRSQLTARFGSLQGRSLNRLNQALDVFVGKKQIFPQRPIGLYIPELPGIQFYEREDFPWLAAIETATPAIRAELLTVLAEDQGLVPYVEYGPGIPLDQWAELNHSPRWSVFHLWRDGGPVAENLARCPQTAAVLTGADSPRLPNRSPAAMFSILRPRTPIPPHTGVTNARLVVHIPLVVPPGCGFRVGNEVREWKVGEAFIFNDTIEHEAWNNSAHDRAVLIFDIWNPALTEGERAMIGELFAGSDAFLGTRPTGEL